MRNLAWKAALLWMAVLSVHPVSAASRPKGFVADAGPYPHWDCTWAGASCKRERELRRLDKLRQLLEQQQEKSGNEASDDDSKIMGFDEDYVRHVIENWKLAVTA